MVNDSDLDGPNFEHFARAERVQVLRLAVEGIVGRRCHLHEYPRGQPLVEAQPAEHGLRDHPLAPAPQVAPRWQHRAVVLHGRDTSTRSIFRTTPFPCSSPGGHDRQGHEPHNGDRRHCQQVPALQESDGRAGVKAATAAASPTTNAFTRMRCQWIHRFRRRSDLSLPHVARRITLMGTWTNIVTPPWSATPTNARRRNAERGGRPLLCDNRRDQQDEESAAEQPVDDDQDAQGGQCQAQCRRMFFQGSLQGGYIDKRYMNYRLSASPPSDTVGDARRIFSSQ